MINHRLSLPFQTDLSTVLETLYKSDASGFIIWGSSNDVNTVDKCRKLLKYTTDVLGPAITRYTKPHSIRNGTEDSGTTNNPVSSSIGLTTWRPVLKDHLDNSNSSQKPAFLDPEYHWDPPENYTQDIAHYVEQEFKKKPEYNVNNSKGNQTVLENVKKNVLIELILNFFKNDVNFRRDVANETTVKDLVINNEDKTLQTVEGSTNISFKSKNYSIENSTPNSSLLTQNPLDSLKLNTKGLNTAMPETGSDIILNSTYRLNQYISSTPPIITYLTGRYSTNGEKGEDNSEKDTVINSQEYITTEIDTTANSTPLDASNDEIELSVEQFSVSNTTISDSTKTTQLPSDEKAYVTETSFSTENDRVISTSQEFINVPFKYNVENNLSTISTSTYEEILNYLNDTTEDFMENTSRTTLNPQNIESSTEPFQNLGTSSTTKNELSREIIYDDSDSINSKETFTEDYIMASESYLAEPVIINLMETSTTKDNIESKIDKEITHSFNSSSVESHESSTSENLIKGTTEFLVTTDSKNVPDSVIENFSVEANTTDAVTSTTEDPQVVVFL